MAHWMRVNNALFLTLLLILIPLSFAASSATVSLPFSGTSAAAQLTKSGLTSYPLSPANQVYNYNTQNGLYLITCPQAPAPSSSSPQLFSTTGFQDFGAWFLAGNECQAGPSGSYPVTVSILDELTPPPPTSLPSSSLTNALVNLFNAVRAQITNIGYSPQLQSAGQNFVSSFFNSKTNIFDGVPVSGQQGMWTWSAIYADLSYLNGKIQISSSNSVAATYTYTLIVKKTLSGNGGTQAPQGPSPTFVISGGGGGGGNTISSTTTIPVTITETYTCQYSYTLNSQVTLTDIQNNQLPFSTGLGYVQIGLLPYFIYGASMGNFAPANEFNYSLSYDIYDPLNYQQPQNRIDPFTINSLGLFVGNYMGSMSYVYTAGGVGVTLLSTDSQTGFLYPQQTTSGSTIYSTNLAPLSVAGTPNGYIFALASDPNAASYTGASLSDASYSNLQQPSTYSKTPGNYSSQSLPSFSQPSSSADPSAAQCLTNAVCSAAYSQIGVPYCWAGEAPKGTNPFVTSYDQCNGGSGLTPGISTTSGGFDCSGLSQWAARQAGFNLAAHYTVTQFNSETTAITQAQALPGDLVFFNDFSGAQPGHVGICYNVGCTCIIDAPETGMYVSVQPTNGGLPVMGYRRIPGNNQNVQVSSLPKSNSAGCPNPQGGGGGGNGGGGSGTPASPTLSPILQQYENSVMNSGVNLYVLKVIPAGYYNTSLYPPNVVSSASTNAQFQANWQNYWKNVKGLQGQNVYAVNVIPSSVYLAPVANWDNNYYQQNQYSQSFSPSQFMQYNVTSDSYGDVYISGYDSGLGNNWVIRVANAVGNGPISITGNIISCSSVSGNPCANNRWPEIAVSPLGSQVYLGSPLSGIIPEFDGSTLAYESGISLSYVNDNSLYGSISFQVPGGAPPPAANIVDYLANGGLYNITTQCGGKAQQPCSTPDNIMKNIINQENYDLQQCNSQKQGYICSTDTADVLDKATYPNSNNNNNYHHILSLVDLNGYLYVLDYWDGVTGQACSHSLTIPFWKSVCASFNPFSTSEIGGIKFSMITMRIINTSGVDLPIEPTFYNDLWQCTDSKCSGLTKLKLSNDQFYPPYGWIISANVSSNQQEQSATPAQLQASDMLPISEMAGVGSGPGQVPLMDAETLNMCGGSPTPPSGIMPCYQPSSYYKGSTLPIGPLLKAAFCSSAGGLFGFIGQTAGCGMAVLQGASMSTSFNNTISIFIPGWSGQNVPNTYDELLFAHINPQNYTKPIGGLDNPAFRRGIDWSCIVGNINFNSNSKGVYDSNYVPGGGSALAACNYHTQLDNFQVPIYLASNPFQITENIGGYQILSFDSIFGAGFSSNGGTGSTIGSCTTKSGTQQCTLSSSANTAVSSGVSGASGTKIPSLDTLGALGTLPMTSLNSIISGYTVLPFYFDYQKTWYVSNIQGSSSNNQLCSDASLRALTSPQQSTATVYTDSPSDQQQSNPSQANVESASSYAKSALNATYYYQANLSAIIIPSTLVYNLLSNRLFGKIYVNATTSSQTNLQQIVNSMDQYSYNSVTYMQGSLPGYEMFVADQHPQVYGAGSAAPMANVNNQYGVSNNFSVTKATSLPVLLFNWFKLPASNNYMYLQLSASLPGSTETPYGYHRIIYVYNDRFNNTIYMPLDADIANITQLSLQVTPSVNAINVNQTELFINGTATWTPPFSAKTVPLKNGYIYIYYDRNLNTIGYNAIDDPVDAATCAFSNVSQPSYCTLANPVWNGLQYNSNPIIPGGSSSSACGGTGCNLNNGLFPDGSPYISANIVTYSPEFDSSGSCPAPSNSLLTPINQIYTICNIYPNNHFGLSNICPTNAQGKTQYCNEVFYNGTGICTSQIGLVGIYQTDQNGKFTANIIACGAGSPSITAQFYGSPTPQPIYAHQSPLGSAANPSSGQYESFATSNYVWTPAQASQSTQIGSFLLSLGPIFYLPAFLALIAAAVILYGMLHKSYGTNKRRPRKERI